MTLEAHIHLPGRPLTLDDVAELAAAAPHHRYELDKGVLIVMPPADTEQAKIVARLTYWLLREGGLDVDAVLANIGVQVARDDGGTGRCPDLVVMRDAVISNVVWHDPALIQLIVEVVSRGSEGIDRLIKPIEYAQAGIPNFWRIERAAGSQPAVHTYRLSVDENGHPTYIGHRAVPLDELLAGPVPKLD